MNRRYLLIFVVSLGIHLAFLAIRFQQNGSFVAGSTYDFIGLVADSRGGFAPREKKVNQEIKVEKSSIPHPSHHPRLSVKHTQKITSPLPPPPKQVMVPTLEKTPETAVPGKKFLETVSSALSEVRGIANAAQASSLLSESANLRPPVDAVQGQVQSEPPAEGVARPIVALVDAVPRYADNPKPEYPEVARRKGWAGEVHLLVRVDEVGAVDRISVSRSSGYSALDRAARRAVRLWRFIPATNAGQRVSSEVVVPIDFRLPVNGESGFSPRG